MKKTLLFYSCIFALLFASCAKQKSCYEITLTVQGQSETMYVYAEESEADAQATEMMNRFLALGLPKDAMKVDIRKLDKSESDCTKESVTPSEQNPEIKRTVKPAASFEIQIEGINPDGFSPEYNGIRGICGHFPASFTRVLEDGHSSHELYQLRILSDKVSMDYGMAPDAWRDEFVHDNSYVGARIICLTPSDKTVDHLTESEKTNIRGWLEVYAQGSPDGPFTLKKTCTWKFRLGRDSTYTYVDEIVETYQNAQECIDGILNHDASNPIFQSLYYYDAQKDEFILQDRTSWNLK